MRRGAPVPAPQTQSLTQRPKAGWAGSKRGPAWMILCSCDTQTPLPVFYSSTSCSVCHVTGAFTLTVNESVQNRWPVVSRVFPNSCCCFLFFYSCRVQTHRTGGCDVRSVSRWLSRLTRMMLMTADSEALGQTLLCDGQTWDLNTVIYSPFMYFSVQETYVHQVILTSLVKH